MVFGRDGAALSPDSVSPAPVNPDWGDKPNADPDQRLPWTTTKEMPAMLTGPALPS